MNDVEFAALRVRLLGGDRVPHGHPAREELLAAIAIGEAADDEHFYGAWQGGAKSEGGHAMPGKGASVEAHVRAGERSDIDRPGEVARCYDPATGKELLMKPGERAAVDFTEAEGALFKDKILTHNHPGEGNGLSAPDVRYAIRMDIAEIRCTGTQNGQRYAYKLKRPPGGWKKTHAAEYLKAEHQTQQLLQMRVNTAFERLGKPTGERIDKILEEANGVVRFAEQNHHHLAAERFAKAIGAQYEREEWT